MEKLKYKIKPNTSIKIGSDSYIIDYLKSLGISNPKSFIERPRLEDQEYFGNLDNIDQAVKMLYEGFKSNKKFFLQVDSDVDGITSSAIFYGFFKRLFPEARIEYRLHNGKEHGIILNTIPIDTDYVIIPDAGSMQIDEQEKMSQIGYKVIIIDHHHADTYIKFENVCMVNNQLSQNFKNKNLSGAGMVYKVIHAFNITYQEEFPLIYSEYADLAALGIIADMMDTRDPDNNYIIYKGLNNIKNPMLKALLQKQEYSISSTTNPTKIDIAFYIAPLMNGVIRFGDDMDKAELFKGFIENNIEEIIETTYAGRIREEKFYDYIARISYNIKEKQNREKMKSMTFLKERIEKNHLQDNQLLIVKISKDDDVIVPQTITGLVAMELLKEYKKPTLVLRPRNDNGTVIYAGSGRGKINGEFDSLRDFLIGSGLCEYAEGHDMAHGVAIKEENLPKLIEYANTELANIQFDVEEMEVDFIFNDESLKKEIIQEFGSVNHIYGMGIPQPKFAFELTIYKGELNFIGRGGNTIKFRTNGVDFLKFNAKKLIEEIDKIDAPALKIKLVGRSQINEWGGNITPQVMIDGIEVAGIEQTYDRLF